MTGALSVASSRKSLTGDAWHTQHYSNLELGSKLPMELQLLGDTNHPEMYRRLIEVQPTCKARPKTYPPAVNVALQWRTSAEPEDWTEVRRRAYACVLYDALT